MPSSKWPSEDDAELLVSMYLSFSPPDDNGRLLIHDFDVTDAFYKLQRSLQTQKWKFSLEDHIHYALASTSVLIFLTVTIDHIETTYNIKKPPMPTETVMDIIKIIQEVLDRVTTREMAAIRLLKFNPADKNTYKFAKAAAELVKKPATENTNEMEFRSRLIDPFLSGLLDEPNQAV
ncbi:hypothetical protein G6F70_002567 [Rhizopus microsporus]|uniref:Uncharacterized protein n=1 Tax=Rhizopus azygosporus TaxID=86630 RepID=A0A367JR93_RHIAZ|nr:hypothetical protein G6F71_005885 [Rhizopus microsporus]RCH92211.1 hypothetical protein CU097_012297 [Rhizopus azygosporus]KAG1202077.1 hypothetical protein G6F70_002567 [Rhizopus microsporus]KAG1209228.1 hypothetical protein G6F69_006540 [Rhizopus microsporus]KAG1231603.1 hypothetical protein G6F67_005632 [Rhizopus microsporus]